MFDFYSWDRVKVPYWCDWGRLIMFDFYSWNRVKVPYYGVIGAG